MKRLLFFLLLIAISGCSNNLSYKTKEGNKNFIREDTVQLQKLTRDDFKEKYEKFIADKSKSFQSEITNINSQINVLESRIKEAKKGDFFDDYYIEKYKIRSAKAKTKLAKTADDWAKWLSIYMPSLKSLKEDLQGTPKVHLNNISFTVVQTDLLNNKKILPRFENVVCFNPKLDKKYRTIWESKLGENYVPPDNICKKFAKF
tara:strand:- start:81 stop:689 length:609 start_codon:yes stop_codon:yes gene_type:complete